MHEIKGLARPESQSLALLSAWSRWIIPRLHRRANGDDRNPALFLQTGHHFIGEAGGVNLCGINWLFEYRHIGASPEKSWPSIKA
jgi:hypothetical protein